MATKRQAAKLSAVAKHRIRQRRRGLRRLEVQVPGADAPLVRAVAAALSDPTRAEAARMLLRTRIMAPPETSLKALLEAAPLDGIDLERSQDPGRPVEF